MCKKIVNKEIKKIQAEISNLTDERSKGNQNQVIGGELAKFFRNYALELYGASVLDVQNQQSSEDLTLKTIFDKVFENQLEKFDIEHKFRDIMNQSTKKIQKAFTEQINEEVEEMQLQINCVRNQVANQKKKKRMDESQMEDSENMQFTNGNL